MNAQTKASQDAITPEKALELLQEGNQRFIAKQTVVRDLNLQVEQTSTGQYPFATVLKIGSLKADRWFVNHSQAISLVYVLLETL